MNKTNIRTIAPKIRFKKFKNSSNWRIGSLGTITIPVEERAKSKKCVLLSLTAGVGLVSQIEKFGKEIAGESYKNYLVIKKYDFAYNKSATKQYPQGFITIQKDYDEAALPSSIFTCFRIVDKECLPEFFNYLFFMNYHGKWLKKYISVGARAHGALNVNTKYLWQMPIAIPAKEEQESIAECLKSIDNLIQKEEEKFEQLQTHKKGLLQKLYPQNNSCVPELRFKSYKQKWEKTTFDNLLNYERPEKYIVENTNYESSGTPVLTANKAFILGYSSEKVGIYKKVPVILFDDFTTDKKFVDFPFKVKSSAIKILKPRGQNNLKFIFELMNNTKFTSTEHKRYYISTYKNITVYATKNQKEQQKIAECISSLDDLISAQIEKIELLKQHKRGLLQGLFPSIEEVEND